jgi:hypothetical protein
MTKMNRLAMFSTKAGKTPHNRFVELIASSRMKKTAAIELIDVVDKLNSI